MYEYLTGKSNYTTGERCRRFLTNGPSSKVSNNITVVTTMIPCVFFNLPILQTISETIRTVQHILIFKFLQRFKRLKKDKVLLWLQRPEFNSRYIKHIPHWKIFYDCTEDYVELLKNENPTLLNKYKKDDTTITEKADMITTVSKEYAAIKVETNQNTHWISNGVDCRAFAETVTEDKEEKGDRMPVLCFIGILNSRHDLDLIIELAQNYPDCLIELVGHVNNYVSSEITKRDILNIQFIPGIPSEGIPLYLQGVSVCLSLFKHNYLNQTCSSMKIYQYLASGKPIVSYPVSDAEYFNDVIYLADNRRRYLELVSTAMNEPLDGPKVTLRKEYARRNDWT
ncbi:MAG: hypothetical protein ACE5HI_19065, partial [bacterium]